jgi:hypothetical protein
MAASLAAFDADKPAAGEGTAAAAAATASSQLLLVLVWGRRSVDTAAAVSAIVDRAAAARRGDAGAAAAEAPKAKADVASAAAAAPQLAMCAEPDISRCRKAGNPTHMRLFRHRCANGEQCHLRLDARHEKAFAHDGAPGAPEKPAAPTAVADADEGPQEEGDDAGGAADDGEDEFADEDVWCVRRPQRRHVSMAHRKIVKVSRAASGTGAAAAKAPRVESGGGASTMDFLLSRRIGGGNAASPGAGASPLARKKQPASTSSALLANAAAKNLGFTSSDDDDDDHHGGGGGDGHGQNLHHQENLRTASTQSKLRAADSILVAGSKVALRCPLSFAKMQHPARGLRCAHDGCFDLATYILSCDRRNTWNCPLCDGPVYFSDLTVDALVARALRETTAAMFDNGGDHIRVEGKGAQRRWESLADGAAVARGADDSGNSSDDDVTPPPPAAPVGSERRVVVPLSVTQDAPAEETPAVTGEDDVIIIE